MGCYFCGGGITGVEHIPPRCFFPNRRRQDLITVGSCDIHNQEKSKEDEYIRAILLSSIKTDSQSHLEELKNTHVRALERSIKRALEKEITKEQMKEVIEIIERYEDDPVGGAKAFDEIASKGVMCIGLMGLLHKGAQEESAVDSNGEEVKTTSFIYDRDRFDRFFESMARGIFLHELGKRWEGEVYILPHTFLRADAPQRDKDLSNYYLRNFDSSKSKGAQKEFFCYDRGSVCDPVSNKRENIFFNFCLFNTFYFTAIFPL